MRESATNVNQREASLFLHGAYHNQLQCSGDAFHVGAD